MMMNGDDDELFLCYGWPKKVISLISSQDYYQRSSPSRISDKLQVGFEFVQNLSSDLVEWSCAVVITLAPHGNWYSSIWLGKVYKVWYRLEWFEAF